MHKLYRADSDFRLDISRQCKVAELSWRSSDTMLVEGLDVGHEWRSLNCEPHLTLRVWLGFAEVARIIVRICGARRNPWE